nr:hypothetical protein [Tanacetum cinerariifolium]
MMGKGSKNHNLGFNSTSAHGNAAGMNPNKAAHGVVGGSGSVPNQGLKLSQSATIVDVSQQIDVPLNTLGDIDNLTKAIDLGKLEVWSDLPSEKRTEVMEIIWAMWDAFLTKNPNTTRGYSSDSGKSDVVIDSGKSDVVIGESLTIVEGVASFFGVPQKMQVDYEIFAKGIKRGTYEVWSKLTSIQRKAILKTAHNGWNALLELESAGLGTLVITVPSVVSCCEPIVKTIDTDDYSDPIVQFVDINTIPTSYVGAVVVEKVSSWFENTLYGYFIGKRMAFSIVEYYARNNWGNHGLKRIMMNSKGFFFFKFDSQSGLEAVLEVCLCENSYFQSLVYHEPSVAIVVSANVADISIGTDNPRLLFWTLWFLDNHVRYPWGYLQYTLPLLGQKSCEAVTISIPSLTREDFTKETIRVEYEWRPPRSDECKIFGHVHDQCPKKVVSPPIVATSNVVNTSTVVNPTVENDGFQVVGKKKGKPKTSNSGQFVGHSIHQNLRYKPKASTNAPKKVANVGNASISSSLLKNKVTSSHQDNTPHQIPFLP